MSAPKEELPFADTVAAEEAPATSALFVTKDLLQDLFDTPPRCPETVGLYLNPIQLYYLSSTAKTVEGPVLLGRTLAYSYILARESCNLVASKTILDAVNLADPIARDSFDKIVSLTSYNVRST